MNPLSFEVITVERPGPYLEASGPAGVGAQPRPISSQHFLGWDDHSPIENGAMDES